VFMGKHNHFHYVAMFSLVRPSFSPVHPLHFSWE
jgi:hypothetical protein